ncbi:MAG: flagellar hook-basal body protein [Eubacteriales bacterium]
MIRSLYTLNRNMNILQKKQENTSANISNANTPGYKFQNIIQSTLEVQNLVNFAGGPNIDQLQELGTLPLGNQIDGVYTNFEQGNMMQTDLFTDIAIHGNGFFTVALDNGQMAFTRNGNFKINDNHQLVTMEGYPVLAIDNNGQISDIIINHDDFKVGNSGEIIGQNKSLMIVDFGDYNSLQKLGDTLYIPDNNQFNVIQGNTSQGLIETSNVKLIDEMVKMIEISREFESNQKLLHSADDTLNKAVNEIGKV